MIRFLVPFLLLLFIDRETDASSTGAASCADGKAAVDGIHLDTTDGRAVRSGTLAEFSVVVQIGTTILDVSVVNDFPVGQDLQISVSTPLELPYKGVLVRLEAPTGVNTAAALLPGTNTAIASACGVPIVGITHTNNSLKSTSTGTIRFDTEVLGVVLGITVVTINDIVLSVYSYSEFKVNFRAAPIPPPTPPAPAPSAPGPGMGGGMGGGGMVVGMGGGMGMGW